MGFNLLARSPRRALRALSVTMAGGALAGAWGLGGQPPVGHAASVPPPAADSAEEVSLGALGLTAQPVFGPSGSVAVWMPAPMAPLAPSGSFIQIFFMHSPILAAPGSTVTLAVNGAPVATLPLDASSAGGATFDAPVPAFLLRGDGPNLIEARFFLRAPAGEGASTIYARLDPQTLIHYQLFKAPGGHPVPGLRGYPFPLVGRGGLGRLGLVMPPLSSDGELSSAFRLAADLGRRAYLLEVLPQVVTAHQAEWLRSSATPALLIGTLGRLPLANEVLRAAGFRPGVLWSGPAGEEIGDSDGLVVPAVSPWDGRTPLLLVSGRTEAALANATAALAEAGGPPPSGPYLIAPPRGSRPAPPQAPQAAVFPPRPEEGVGLEALGAGAHTLSFPFVLPAVAANRAGLLDLRLSHGPVASAGASALSIQLNGAAFAQVPLNAANQQDALVRVRPADALLRPGLNTLTLAVRLAGEASNADPSAVRQWARLSPGIQLVLPPPPSGETRLESLPGTVFDAPAGLLVVVERRDDAWLSASARALAALGSRSMEVPPLEVASPGDVRTSSLGDRSAIAIGAGAVAAVDRRYVGPRRSASQALGSGAGTIYERRLTEAPASALLCLATEAPEVVAAAAAGLYRHTLQGPAMGLDAAGASWSLRPDRPVGPSGADTLLALRLLFALAIAAMLVAVGCQVLRPGQASR
jgi:hypothetical protein